MVTNKVRQFLCGLRDHDAVLRFDHGRLSLICHSCGWETPGWDLRGNDAVQQQAAPEAPRVVRMPLVGERQARRVA